MGIGGARPTDIATRSPNDLFVCRLSIVGRKAAVSSGINTKAFKARARVALSLRSSRVPRDEESIYENVHFVPRRFSIALSSFSSDFSSSSLSPSLARHGVSPVVQAVRHVEDDGGVVGQEVVANLIKNLQR